VAYLLGVLENERASVDDRMTSARLLGELGGASEARRMEPLSDRMDESTAEGVNEPVGIPQETLGDVVRESIGRIRTRLGDA
jgi:hypothetical protein